MIFFDLEEKVTAHSKGLLERDVVGRLEIARMNRLKKSLAWTILFVLLAFPLGLGPVEAHPKQTKTVGGYEITYFSDPQDPVVNSPATLYVQARNETTGAQIRVFHFLVEMVPPSGPRVRQHPLANSTVFSFNQPGNWILLFEVGLSGYTFTESDPTVDFFSDVGSGPTSGLLAGFVTILAVAIPRSYQRFAHIFAVVLWLGMMLHVANTYRLSSGSQAGLANFARTFRRADILVALAVGLLVVTGVLRSFAHGLTTVDSLFQSDFGLVLFVKITLASGMIIVGLFNRAFLLKRLETLTSRAIVTTSGPTDISLGKSRTLGRRIFYMTILEMGMGVSAILFGTVFTQIHTIN